MVINYRLQALIFIVLFAVIPPATGQSMPSPAGEKDLDALTERLTARSLMETGNLADPSALMQSDGSWSDIDYADSVAASWTLHMKRLRIMAAIYINPSAGNYLSKELLHRIDQGFAFIYKKPLYSSNWWYSVIGAPNDYMAALILMKNHLQAEKVKMYSAYLVDATTNRAHKGQNRVWVSMITIYKGCIEHNADLVRKGYASIASTLTVEPVQGNEGIKIDHSFHQHRPQLYSGGYGLGYVRDVAEMIALSHETAFETLFTAEKKAILSGLALKGHQLLEYRDVVDFGTIGRNISRENGLKGMDTGTLNNLSLIDKAHAIDYAQWKAHLTGKPFSASHAGNNYFWKSDIMTHRGCDYYLSAKVISTRTVGTEMLNEENLKGFNLPLGATNIMTHGHEYMNIFPLWDWAKVPGTTAVNNPSSVLLPWYLYGSNQFAGGASNGKAGVIAYEHSYNGVQAKKAYFFMGDAMLCLGAGINALGVQSVQTTVNQTLLNGDVAINTGNKTELLNESGKVFHVLRWIYHDGVGYIFPESSPVSISKAPQSGTWKSLNANGSEDLITKNIFSVWFNHGTAPVDAHYQYLVAPAKSKEALAASKVPNHFKVVCNTANIQAVSYEDYYAVVFYEPGSVVMPDGLSISSKMKAVVLINRAAGGYDITAADPTHKQPELILVLNRKPKGTGVINRKNDSVVKLHFPNGDNIGNSVSRHVKKTI